MAQTRQILGYLSSALDNIGSQAISGSHASLSDVGVRSGRRQTTGGLGRQSPAMLRRALSQQLQSASGGAPGALQGQGPMAQALGGNAESGGSLADILLYLRRLTRERRALEQAGAPEELLSQIDDQIESLTSQIQPEESSSPLGAESEVQDYGYGGYGD